MRVALAQICTGPDVAANLDLIAAYAQKAAEQGAELVVFPEATMRAFGYPLAPIAEPIDGPFATRVCALARQHALTIVTGMFTPGTPSSDGPPLVRNTLLAASPAPDSPPRGYDKIHLYDAFGFRESDTVEGGEQQVRIQVGAATVGLTICYDVRFPQLFINHARSGADLIIVAASWSDGPHKAEQWQLLTRARALDATAFVLACDQALPSAAGVQAPPQAASGVGYSQIVSPRGMVVAVAGPAPTLLVADLELSEVASARADIAVLTNARLS